MPAVLPVAGGGTAGSAAITTLSRLWNAELNVRRLLYRGPVTTVDWLSGFRWLQFDEAIDIDTVSAGVGSSDRFGADNRFIGGQFGVESEMQYKKLFSNFWGKIGLGGIRNRASIQGTNGFLATPTNIGDREQNQFTYLFEAGANFGIKINDHIRLSAGYTVLFITDVLRPGDLIDTRVGGGSPTFSFTDSGYWVHGLNGGFEFRF